MQQPIQPYSVMRTQNCGRMDLEGDNFSEKKSRLNQGLMRKLCGNFLLDRS
jgi:hypothetical protein